MATGVGLGLAVVKLNTSLLGGALAVEKRAGGGLCFTVEIPDASEGAASGPQLSAN
jgi:K+-sensing histidine kinase KdpD